MRSDLTVRRPNRSAFLRCLALAAVLTAALLALMSSGVRTGPGRMERSSFRGGAGYWLLAKDGGVFAFGDAQFFGPNRNQGNDIAGMAATATGNGYWTVDDDGDVFAYGDAVDYGSRPGPEIDNIKGFGARPQGDGYWMVASDGSVYAFGAAAYFGAANGLPLSKPIVGITATPSGSGYWLIASDGGVFAYGDAKFFGSTGAIKLARPIVDFAPTPDGKGYHFTGSDGGVFAYGTAGFFGSTGAIRLNLPVVGFAPTASGNGYWLVASDGGVFAFGDARFYGSTGSIKLNSAIVAIVATPRLNIFPTARNDAATVTEDGSVTVDVEANDTHVLPAAVSIDTNPAHGTAVVSGTKVVYTPSANSNNSDTFTYKLTDTVGHSATATVAITVTPVNDAPTISDIANQTTNEDTATGSLAFTVGDVETPAGTLTVSASSSNTTLVPNANIVLGGSGAGRTVALTPAADQSGTATITVAVSDGSLTGTDTFVLTVNAANDAPTISNVADLSTNEDTATAALPFTVGDAETAAGSLTVSGSSSNTALVPNANIVLGGSGASRTVTVTPAANQNGTATVTLTVSDGSLTGTDTFVLTVTAVNDAPTISNVVALSTNEDTATAALPFAVGDAETAAGSLTVSGSSSNTTLVPNANIVLGGSGASRTVTVTPAANLSGTATITLTVSDGSLTGTDTFVLTVNAMNDAPTISDIANQSTNEDTATAALGFTVGDVETAAGSLTVSGSSSNTALVPNANIVFGGSGASRTVTVTPAANQNGTATVTVTVSDGTATGTDTFVLTVNPVNDPPTISAIVDLAIDENGTTGPLGFTVSDPDTGDTLTVSTGSSDTILVPNANIALGGSGGARTVTATPAVNQSGAAIITVTVQDGNGGTASESFTLVVAVLDQPVAVDDAVDLLDVVITGIDVLVNDSGLSNGPVTVDIVAGEATGTVDGLNVIHLGTMVDGDLDGLITFQYKVTDADEDFAVGTVTVSLL